MRIKLVSILSFPLFFSASANASPDLDTSGYGIIFLLVFGLLFAGGMSLVVAAMAIRIFQPTGFNWKYVNKVAGFALVSSVLLFFLLPVKSALYSIFGQFYWSGLHSGLLIIILQFISASTIAKLRIH